MQPPGGVPGFRHPARTRAGRHQATPRRGGSPPVARPRLRRDPRALPPRKPQISPPVLIAATPSDRRWLPPPPLRPDRPRRPTLPRTRHHRQSTHGHRAVARVVALRVVALRVVASSISGTLESEPADDSGPSTSCDARVEVAAGSSAGASGTAGSIGGAEVDGGGDESRPGNGSTVVSSAAGRAAANPVSGRGAVRWAMAATALVETVPGSRAPARSPVKCGSPLLGTASLAHEEVRKKSATHTPMPTARRWGRRGHVDMVALKPNAFVLRRRVNLECALGCRTGAGQWSAGRLALIVHGLGARVG